MKKTLWGLTLAGLIMVLVKLVFLFGLFGEGAQIDLVTNLILGILFLVISLGLVIFWMGLFLKIFDLPEDLNVSLNQILISGLINLAAAILTLFVA